MMKPYPYIRILILAFAVLSFTACSDEDHLLQTDGENVSVTFRPKLGNDINTRTIGDATGIDRLTVAVYEEGSQNLSKKFSFTKDWDIAQNDGIQLTLIEGHTYEILFWADDKDNSAYTINDNGRITVDYTHYQNGGFAKMEEMDAFLGTSSITVGTQKVENKEITLSRPFAQLNFSDKSIRPEQGVHQSVVTFHSIPTSFNPFTGEVTLTDADDDTDDITFTFTDFPTTETLEFGNATYYYVSCNYLFAPSSSSLKVSTTLDLQGTDGSSINKFEFKGEKAITLDRNKKTNVYGNIVEQPQNWSVWDGNIPTESTLTTDPNDQNRYIIDEAADIAWLSVEDNSSTLDPDKTFVLTTDIDMAGKDNLSSIQLPSGSTVDGDDHTIKGIILDNAVFGDASSVSIRNLKVEETHINNTNTTETTHVGVLLNTLDGSATFTNVTIKNSTASTSKGAAGGIVGYIKRTGSEPLNVVFDNCHVTETTVEGTHSEGHFVGLLRGYDNDETLTFKDNCTLDNITSSRAEDFASPYTEGNEAAWLAGNDYSKFNGWLGNEECYRGQVYYGTNRFIPKWDGTTIVDPLLVEGTVATDHKYLVYSAFDLAGVRNKTASPAALYLMENVDMNGQGEDGKFDVPNNWTQKANASDDDNYFKSFSTIAYLDGYDNGIYNLNINTQKVSTSLYYGGFIQSSSGTTTHQNIQFHNCCIVVPLVVNNNEDKGSAGMLISNIAGDSYTMNNVHTYGCQVFALQKVGGLAARVAATTVSISNCSVNSCYIENYECKEHIEEFGGGLARFYSYGEVGGMFGFVQDNTTITNCHVKNTTIYAFGQDDQLVGVVPGRHVSTFIGDIRTYIGGTITIKDSSADSNTKCTKRHDQHSYGGFFGIGGKKVKEIGKCYYVATDDKKGKVVFNGTTIFS